MGISDYSDEKADSQGDGDTPSSAPAAAQQRRGAAGDSSTSTAAAARMLQRAMTTPFPSQNPVGDMANWLAQACKLPPEVAADKAPIITLEGFDVESFAHGAWVCGRVLVWASRAHVWMLHHRVCHTDTGTPDHTCLGTLRAICPCFFACLPQ
jgi:hypothetical protein